MGVDKIKTLVESYRGKKVFVTGHTGFKGSWLIKILNYLGAEVKGYSLSPKYELNLFDEISGSEICDSEINDIRNKEALLKSIQSFQPDFVFHLAAQPLVRDSFEIPSETFEINAIGTANLLEVLHRVNLKCSIVLITTDKVYHNYEWEFPYRENDRLGGFDPYSASKACAEIIIESFRNSFFNISKIEEHKKSIAVGRAGNVIGGGDWAVDRLIPDIVKSLSIKQDIIIRNPLSIRPWQHVIEPLFGYLELGKRLSEQPEGFSKAYNFGPNSSDTLSVLKMVEKSITYWGGGKYRIDKNDNHPHEAGILKLDITRVISDLDWKPIFNSQIALERTIAWYKGYYEGESAKKLVEADIEFYLDLK
jgi:CDP-glucose 4,6-dehydratase